jgi:hypothetical protein
MLGEKIMRYDDINLDQDLTYFKSIKDTEVIIGGLSKPSKMPWLGWSISAHRCKVGSKLAKVKDSVCHSCYALKGRYVFDKVQNALERRYDASQSPLFVPAFIYTLRKKSKGQRKYFRWFDSGDIQNGDMLFNINTIARYTPNIQHWLPTKEAAVCREVLKEIGVLSPNLTIRISASMMDGKPPGWWPVTSTVYTKKPVDNSSRCPAPEQGNNCGECRKCWDKTVSLVSYHAH